MSKGKLAVLGLAAALAIGTTIALLEYRSRSTEGSVVELTSEDLSAKPPRDDDAGVALVEDDDDGQGGAGDGTRSGDRDGTRGDDGTGGGNNTGDGDSTRGDDGTGGGNNTGGVIVSGNTGGDSGGAVASANTGDNTGGGNSFDGASGGGSSG